jgi:hypothetical protein
MFCCDEPFEHLQELPQIDMVQRPNGMLECTRCRNLVFH